MTHRTQLAVCAYSLPHMLRYQPDKAGEFCTRGFTLNMLADLAVNHGLAGIEFPLETSTPVLMERQLRPPDLPETSPQNYRRWDFDWLPIMG